MDFNIIPIEDHQPTFAEDLHSYAESVGMIDQLKKFAAIEFKKDRKIKIVKFTDVDGEPSWRVDLLNGQECLWYSEFDVYRQAQNYKKLINGWCEDQRKDNNKV